MCPVPFRTSQEKNLAAYVWYMRKLYVFLPSKNKLITTKLRRKMEISRHVRSELLLVACEKALMLEQKQVVIDRKNIKDFLFGN